eukprot:7149893-Prymnesium_polylepis.1
MRRGFVVTDSEMSDYYIPGSSPAQRALLRSEGASTSCTASAAGRPSGRLRGGGWMMTGTPSADPAMADARDRPLTSWAAVVSTTFHLPPSEARWPAGWVAARLPAAITHGRRLGVGRRVSAVVPARFEPRHRDGTDTGSRYPHLSRLLPQRGDVMHDPRRWGVAARTSPG